MVRHKNLTGTDIHVIHAFTFADAAARTGATGLVAADVGKVAKQTDNNSYYVLTAITPTWLELTGLGVPAAHALGGASHNADTLANLNSKVSDATLIDTGDSRLSDARTPTAHNLGGAEHTADTLANLNSKVSDATLIDTGDARLSDARTPLAHKDTHKSGGSDPFAAADILEATVKRLETSTGPTTMLVGAVADGEFLKRSGTAIVGDAGTGGDTLPIVDTTAVVKGSADATKLVRIEADGLTTGTTRVITMPDVDVTLLDPANVAITGGNIDGTVIGGTTAAAGTLTSLTTTDTGALIRPDTSDGTDNKAIALCGGGEFNPVRGGAIKVFGNEGTPGSKGNIDMSVGDGDGASDKGEILLKTGGVSRIKVTNPGSVVLGALVANAATDGFVYVGTVAGAPTGTPTAQTGTVALVYDTTNNDLYIFNTAWKKVALA